VFRLTDRLDQTVYLLNAGDEDRIFFIPPANQSTKAAATDELDTPTMDKILQEP
jgi:hypothetical protein